MYRLVGRKFHYGVYLTLEIVWGVLAIYVSARNYYFSSGDAPWIVLALLIILSLAHSMTVTLLQPWQKLLAVKMRLFAHSRTKDRGMPIYTVVVGQRYAPKAITRRPSPIPPRSIGL